MTKRVLKVIAGFLIIFNIIPFCLGALAMNVGFTFYEGYIEGSKITGGLMLIGFLIAYAVDLIKQNLWERK